MAEEAFALSPISARAAQPSEEDYAAIREAFMETARGRWFLGEYAKRNRNADTRMVLDAVARIEENLSAQRQAAAEAIQNERLEEALTALRGAVEAAQASAIAALDGVSFEQTLAPVRKGVRVIREISWRLREIGNDGRICDIIDSQASAIEASAAQVSLDDARAVLETAFATLTRGLVAFDQSETPFPATAPEAPTAEAPVETPFAQPSPAAAAPATDVAASAPEPAAPPASAPVVEATVALPPEPTDAALAEAEAALAEAEAAELARVAAEAAADAHDEAVLDIIAMEMGAPDTVEFDDAEMMIAEEMRIADAPPVEPEIMAQASEPAFAPGPEPRFEPPAPTVEALVAETLVVAAPPQARVEPAPEPAAEISLGSTIIASGLVKKPTTAANDPLAPLRRMSQAEKIAFFS
ncbi:hypothetical protein ACFFWD_22105 [Bradyrhizobium erythrophlei]|uniref:hypothetical protein n=1 Tax=Bradyrhizobium erythrophlei TaxID=1437360 RepID=UPI0035EB4C0F